MRITILTGFCVWLLIAMPLYSQNLENTPAAKPMPPNAAELFKNIDRPMGTYTGTLPVSFPLCSVSSGSLTAALSLSYTSTGGLKVEELGGPAGLGFNLSDGGGRITRTVRGLPDDLDYGMLLNNPLDLKPSGFSCNLDKMRDIATYHIDLEPDIYMYSFGGRSGRFYIREDGTIIMTKNDGIKIEFSTGYGGGFDITDEAGNKYSFGNRIDNTSTYAGNGATSSASISSTSWYLLSITDRNGENEITFQYQMSSRTFSTLSGGFMRIAPPDLILCGNFNTNSDMAFVTTDGSEYLVSRIDAESGYILVNSSAAWAYGPRQVNSIQLYDPTGVLKKQYHLNYSGVYEDRLYLSNFSECNVAGNDSLTTRFDYYYWASLPNPVSASVDIWGYYNGASNFNGWFPNIVNYSYYGGTYSYLNFADRTANPAYSPASVLSKITYPSGGYRTLEYEGNVGAGNGDFFTYHPDHHLDAFLVNQSFTETGFADNGSDVPVLQHSFTVNSTTGSATFNFQVINPGAYCGNYYVVIKQVPTGVALATIYQSTGSKLLTNGDYTVEVYYPFGYGGMCTMDGITGTWQENTGTDSYVSSTYGTLARYPRNLGGIRVKEVNDYDPATGVTRKTAFRYKAYSVDSTLGCGMLVSAVNIINIQDNYGCVFPALTPGSSYPLAQEGGAYVVYPEVRTIETNNGWTDQQFSFVSDNSYGSYFPQKPLQDNSWYRGLLTSEKVYDKNGVLQRSKVLVPYIMNATPVQYGWRYKPYWLGPNTQYAEAPLYSTDDPIAAKCTQYESYGGFNMPGQIIETLNTPYGLKSDTTIYYYASYGDYHPLLKEYHSGNMSRAHTRTFKYAFHANSDFNLGLSSADQTMKTTLLGQHYLLPLEVTDSVANGSGSWSFQQGSKYSFGTYGGGIYPTSIRLAQLRNYTSATDYIETNFSGYDSRGNLTEQYKTNDIKEAYLWGYNGQYPVAKVTGSSYATIVALVNTSVLNNPSSEADIQTQLAALRSGLAGSNAQVTTFSYSPLYGMITQTDVNGRNTFYGYDAFGRLKLVRDHAKNIIKKIEYKVNNP